MITFSYSLNYLKTSQNNDGAINSVKGGKILKASNSCLLLNEIRTFEYFIHSKQSLCKRAYVLRTVYTPRFN